MAGTVLTNKGLSLITKLVAAQATLSFSRVAVGTGSVPSGYDPQNMTDLSAYKMDATIESYGVSADQADVAYLVAQISSVGVTAGFAVTEAGVYATDPDDGEILYAYLDLTSDPQYIYASTDAISKFAEITFNVLIGSVSSVTAIVSPGALVKKSDFEALDTRVNSLESPEYDDSGTVAGINSFPDFLGKLVSGTSIFSFFSNLKAGFKFVLHAGQLVNNGLCNEPGKYPLDAAYGKTLRDDLD
ncbi:MAG: phage tail protein, partial [Enterocloster asparagiformis]|nr:phage tail protein [Enterocloster asparagiformis]